MANQSLEKKWGDQTDDNGRLTQSSLTK